MTTEKLSVCINCYNGEAYIRECLESVMWADEVIVQDCSSTDRTVEIAREYTDKVFVVPNNPMVNVNYNKLFERASQEWILLLSQDEHVSPELKEEMVSLLANGAENAAYWIPRRNLILGRWITSGGFGPDEAPQLRLFRRGMARFACQDIHEDLSIEGSLGRLKSHLHHISIHSAWQYVDKISWYSVNQAEVRLREYGVAHWQDFILGPISKFSQRFFLAKGYQDGVHGLAISLLGAIEELIVLMRTWDLTGQWTKSSVPATESRSFRNRVAFCLMHGATIGGRAFVSTTWVGSIVRQARKLMHFGSSK